MPALQSLLHKIKYGDPLIIVSGLPRSGTSMAMKMLDAAGLPLVIDNIREADTDNPKGYYEFERVKDLDKGQDNSWIRDHRGKGIKIISFLLRDLPHNCRYKVIFMRREISEILASQAKMETNRGTENSTEDQRMRKLYEDHLLQVRSMMRFRPNFEWLEVSYNQAVANPRDSASEINQFLGDPFKVEDMMGIVDQSLYRNRNRK